MIWPPIKVIYDIEFHYFDAEGENEIKFCDDFLSATLKIEFCLLESGDGGNT